MIKWISLYNQKEEKIVYSKLFIVYLRKKKTKKSFIPLDGQSTIYSSTTFLEKCRKVVPEKLLEKSGSRKVVDQKKGGFILLIHIFFGSRKMVDQKKKSEFAE